MTLPPSPRAPHGITRRGALASLLTLGAAACTAGSTGADGPAAEAGAGFPLELPNCEATVHVEAPPQRIVLLESAAVTTLDGIGVLDRVVARAGSFPTGYYDADLEARIEAIPALSEDIDATGHLQISQEVVIAQQPDIVFGLPDGLTRETLRDAGAEVIVHDAFCGKGTGRASFDSLYSMIEMYGRIFDRGSEADALTAGLRERVAAASEAAPGAVTAAVLYPSLGGGPLYTYGASGMVTAQLDALGVENVFADTAERVFEIGPEPLLAADPDVVIVLHQGEDGGAAVMEQLTAQAPLNGLRALREDAALPLLFNFSEPASPLVVDGLELIHEWLLEFAS